MGGGSAANAASLAEKTGVVGWWGNDKVAPGSRKPVLATLRCQTIEDWALARILMGTLSHLVLYLSLFCHRAFYILTPPVSSRTYKNPLPGEIFDSV